MKKNITLKNIAQYFNVSIATVSKALKDSYDISDKRKKEIQDFANKHNYKPNVFALNLKGRKTKTIGIIIPSMLNYFFAKVFTGMEEVASKKGYNLITSISNDLYNKEINTIDLFINQGVEGIAVSLSEETQLKQKYDHFEKAINYDIPLVMFDRVTDTLLCDKVIIDDEDAAYKATELFINTGCKNIALLSIIDNTSVGQLRLKGYLKALKENNITINDKLIVKLHELENLDYLLKIMLGSREVDALLCLEESTAVFAIDVLKNQNYKIPEDISVICFTNGKLPKHISPKITTVSQHGAAIGKLTIDFLIERLNNNNSTAPKLKVFKASIIQRETTKKL